MADLRLDAAPGPVPGSEDAEALRAAVALASDGGKRVRPMLVALAHSCLGGRDHPALGAVASAVELLHSAFVVHDDVIDGDDVRRGRPSVPGHFAAAAAARGADPRAARTYAVAGAVLTGDLALAAAVRTLALAPLDQPERERLVLLLDDVVLETAAGELADVRFALRIGTPTLDDAIRMAERKTAAYSFALPMQAGAVLAGAEDAVVDAVGVVGRRLGTAYQLRDDLAGMFGAPGPTGHSDLGDLREGKMTPLMVHARTTGQWAAIAPHLGDPAVTQDAGERVRRALVESGSRAFVERLARHHERAAQREAHRLGLPPGLVLPLHEIRPPPARGVA